MEPNKIPYTQEELKELFYFDANTKNLHWKISRSNCVKVGSLAGSKHFYPSINNYYLTIGLKDKSFLAHRISYKFHFGYFDELLQIDHINHNTLDNSPENLRVVTNRENQKNRKRQHNNLSGVSGVSWYKKYSKWVARIPSENGDRINLGYYTELEDAVSARKEAEVSFGFHQNHGKRL